jgi:hypothetical protein
VAERPECNPRLRPGLCLLLDGHFYAQELGRDRWEFAVEIEVLHAAGLNNNDLRWLVGKGYVEHALETTVPGKAPRRFRRSGAFAPCERNSFVLADDGVALARKLLTAPESGAPPRGAGSLSMDVPYWDAETHSLYWRGRLVKHFKHEAPFQEAILEAFQASNWSCFVVVDLPREEGVNPKARLRVAIRNLNQRSDGRLRFTQEGNGGRIGWHPAD